MGEQLKLLQARIAELEAKLSENSRNSGKPPSSDSPAQKDARRGKQATGRKQGGQPGHKGHKRTLVAAADVTRRVPRDPQSCRRCDADLSSAPALEPIRHQVVDLPEVKPDVTEYVLGRKCCSNCNTITSGTLPRTAPGGMCGPRLLSMIGLLTGVHHISRRSAGQILSDLVGIKLSLGCVSQGEEVVSKSLAVAAEQAVAIARGADAKNVDATSWAQSAKQRTLWVMACTTVTAFCITFDATAAGLKRWMRKTRGILISDRGSQFTFWKMDMRQICWAHLVRKFIALSESPNPDIRQLGESLLLLTNVHMSAWHDFRDGKKTRAQLQSFVRNLEPTFMAHLQRGADMDIRGISGACKNLIEHQAAFFTYAFVEGVEPTNNHAERELRRFVLWRKRSFGSQSERGDRFAERIMTVAHTLRKHGRNVYAFLVDACRAFIRGTEPLLLFDSL
jgi:transposase